MSGVLQVTGSVAAAAATATALMSRDRRLRAAAMLVALGLAAALVIGEAWHSHLRDLRAHPLELAGVVVGGAAVIVALAALCARIRILLPLLLLGALPFRIPINAGGGSANLLLPLYLVIAAGVVLECWRAWREPQTEPREGPRDAVWALGLALSAAVLLYAVQTAYSSDISRAVDTTGFFLVPFGLMYVMLRNTEWTSTLLRGALAVILGEAVVFALIGIVQHQVGEIFWNHKVMESNEFDLSFRVNSLFWDPNIYGRYMGLAALLGAGAVVWIEDRRWLAVCAGAVAVIFAGLVFSFSQTGFLALLAGLGVLCALRWSWRRTLAGAAALLAAAALVVAFTNLLTVNSQAGGTLEQSTSGRSRLASGGFDLARKRPLLGFGSGSFPVEFKRHNPVTAGEASISHTEPITIAAEQGVVGLAVYAALLIVSAGAIVARLAPIAPGLGGRFPPIGGPGSRQGQASIARLSIAAAFVAMVAHTMGYAGFLTDPLTWALLAVGAALAGGQSVRASR